MPLLKNLEGLESLASVAGLQVSGNPSLASLRGLSLATVTLTESLVISENLILDSISPLSGIRKVRSIIGNTAL